MTRYYFCAAHEQFAPGPLREQALAAESAGFDGICCSDHFQPWWPDGQSGQAWVWLGAVAQATARLPVGTAVTAPVHRYHPALVAQAFATLESMHPGRVFLGIGSGESLNESPLGMDWPPPAEQVDRMEEALALIHRLFAGEVVDGPGRYFRTKNAYLYTRPQRRPPIYVSAFGPHAAEVAGRWGDGLWTLAKPEQAPGLIDHYRAAAREPGEILLQLSFSWAPTDEQALEAARVWKGAAPAEFYTDDWHDPAAMLRHAEEHVSDDDLRRAYVISADPDEHVERIREVERLGATIVVLMNVSGADPLGAIRLYGERVLPKLRTG